MKIYVTHSNSYNYQEELYKSGSKPAGSLKVVSNVFIEYVGADDLVLKVSEFIECFGSTGN